MAAYDVRKAGADSVTEFINRYHKRRDNGEKPNKIFYTGNDGVIYTESQVVHTVDHNIHDHLLTIEQMQDVENSHELYDVVISKRTNQKGSRIFHGIPILARLKGKLAQYYVIYEVDSQGRVWFKSAEAMDEQSIKNTIAERTAESLYSLSKDRAQGPDGQFNSAIDISTIREILKNVNGKGYKQMAKAINRWPESAPIQQTLSSCSEPQIWKIVEDPRKKSGKKPDG